MTHHKTVPLLALLAVTFAADAQTPPELAGFGWFADMAGYCWSGLHPDGKTNDTQCYSVQFGRHLRGTIKVSGPAEGTQPAVNFEGDSVYAFNAKTNRVQYTLWSSDGRYGTGEMYVEGDHAIFPPANLDSPTAMRMVWLRIDAESFVVTREQRQEGVWKKVFEVTYRRSEK